MRRASDKILFITSSRRQLNDRNSGVEHSPPITFHHLVPSRITLSIRRRRADSRSSSAIIARWPPIGDLGAEAPGRGIRGLVFFFLRARHSTQLRFRARAERFAVVSDMFDSPRGRMFGEGMWVTTASLRTVQWEQQRHCLGKR